MTVKELRDKLEEYGDDIEVVILQDNGEDYVILGVEDTTVGGGIPLVELDLGSRFTL